MKFIPLTNSRFSAIVDDEDYEKVIDFNKKWWVIHDKDKKPMAIVSYRKRNKINGKGPVYLHRLIMGCIADNGLDVDHRFGNIFDNRRSFQLRWATFSQNAANRRKYKNNTSGEKGIYFHIRDKMWCVSISMNNKRFFREFKTLEEAKRFRDEKLNELHGEFSNKG